MLGQVVTAKLLDPETILKTELKLELGHQVADLGCGGAGYFTLPVARMVGSRGRVYAVDVLKSALDGVASKAKLESLTNIETVWSDVERIGATKVPAGTLDAALLVNIMFQSRKNEEMLKEAGRLLKVGGKLLVIDWKVAATPFGPPMEQRIPPEQLTALAKKVGFVVNKELEAGPYHYGVLFVKQ